MHLVQEILQAPSDALSANVGGQMNYTFTVQAQMGAR